MSISNFWYPCVVIKPQILASWLCTVSTSALETGGWFIYNVQSCPSAVNSWDTVCCQLPLIPQVRSVIQMCFIHLQKMFPEHEWHQHISRTDTESVFREFCKNWCALVNVGAAVERWCGRRKYFNGPLCGFPSLKICAEPVISNAYWTSKWISEQSS